MNDQTDFHHLPPLASNTPTDSTLANSPTTLTTSNTSNADQSNLDTVYEGRFDRVVRLVGLDAFNRLSNSHVIVFGVGGVGSFAAESLARSGIGKLTLIDCDLVARSNINRQLPALDITVGDSKVDVLAARFRRINPALSVVTSVERYTSATPESLFQSVDCVVDAIDDLPNKAHLIVTARRLGIPIVTSMGAGGKLDPTQIRVDDLCRTHTDGLARALRHKLRQEYGIDTTHPLGLPAIFSPEPRVAPRTLPGDPDSQPTPQGTLSCVTGAFGLAAASVVIRLLLESYP